MSGCLLGLVSSYWHDEHRLDHLLLIVRRLFVIGGVRRKRRVGRGKRGIRGGRLRLVS